MWVEGLTPYAPPNDVGMHSDPSDVRTVDSVTLSRWNSGMEIGVGDRIQVTGVLQGVSRSYLRDGELLLPGEFAGFQVRLRLSPHSTALGLHAVGSEITALCDFRGRYQGAHLDNCVIQSVSEAPPRE